jgi:hypothetical protein
MGRGGGAVSGMWNDARHWDCESGESGVGRVEVLGVELEIWKHLVWRLVAVGCCWRVEEVEGTVEGGLGSKSL